MPTPRISLGHANNRQEVLATDSSHRHRIYASYFQHRHRSSVCNFADRVPTVRPAKQAHAVERTSRLPHVARVTLTNVTPRNIQFDSA
jgi:hypothetical protein